MSAYGSGYAIDIPRLPVGAMFESVINWLRNNLAALFDIIGDVIDSSVAALSGFLTDPSAAQLTLIACLVIAIGLIRRGQLRLVGVLVAAYLALVLLEALTGAVTVVISSLPGALFIWAMNLFGAAYVYPPLVLVLLLLAALLVTSAVRTASRHQWILAAGVTGAWLLLLIGVYIVGVQFELFAVLIFASLAWFIAGWRLAVFTVLGFLLVISMERWAEAMSTLALVLVATGVAVVFAIPIGVIAAYSDRVSMLLKPVLDFMQTMPAFVYLIPAIAFFGVGQVPGVIATVVFAMPPGVRLTELGIRQVDKELVEAGEAFGAPDIQVLRGIQLPLALATIMAGINQVIMLSLSMVVIAGMVGAGGLGNVVYSGIARADIVLGFEGGIAVVIVAIFLDRLTAAVPRFSPAARAKRMALG
ncbi:ABC transporter permease [Allosalinactinospora lopnorensis]|uniref:ABC transporter permease n=1 Tax=Allosalinactinospora lopnorensis TaxID=1352348 RepID=UPI000623C6B1|nr:ABC transporter permease subunit [Allosalinactinospora lopnorensis]